MKRFDPRYDLDVTTLDGFVWKTMKYTAWLRLRNRCLLAALVQLLAGLVFVPFASLWWISFILIGAGFLAMLRAAAIVGGLLFEPSPWKLTDYFNRR